MCSVNTAFMKKQTKGVSQYLTGSSELDHQSYDLPQSDNSTQTNPHKVGSESVLKEQSLWSDMIENVSRRAFNRTARVYNVRANEPSRDKKHKRLTATVIFLDETQHDFVIERKAPGHILLDQVFEHLELIEKDYFGLQYTEDDSEPSAGNAGITHWLDPNKVLKKQISGLYCTLWLAVRFYPPDPAKLGEEYTKHLLCLQIRKLLLDEKLLAPRSTALLLASYVVQAELGDYDPDVHGIGYLSEMSLLPQQVWEDERCLEELHRRHKGQSPAHAEENYLMHAHKLQKYGVAEHPAKDFNNKDITIGITSNGIIILQNNIKMNDFPWAKIVKIAFKKKRFFIQIKKEPSEDYNTHLGFKMSSSRAAKALWRCSVEQHSFFRLQRPRARRGALLDALGSLAGLGAPRVVATESQALEAAKKVQSLNRVFVRTQSTRGGNRASMHPVSAKPARVMSPRAHLGRVTAQERSPRPAWGLDLLSQSAPLPRAPIHIDDDEGGLEHVICDSPLPFADASSSSECDEEGTVRLSAGADGLFGFNVRGGRGAPVIVSRVAADTPAHGVVHEGDKVISINGVEVQNLATDKIIYLIRSTRGTLTLKLKPNGVKAEDMPCAEEPPSVFVPIGEESAGCGDALAQSMLLLGDGLASGAALCQYETLLRRLTDEPCAHARMHTNMHLNRYRDIVAYDKTRVILKNGPNGDYINASYIDMEIPTTDTVLTYIATQGPLPYTVGDFWQMVWECETTLVVMLTVLAESDRAKCHQYWSDVGRAPLKVTGTLTLHTLSETNSGYYVHREMLLKESGAGGASRMINHLQYVSWPDHGVPSDPAAFIHFTELCTKLRTRRPVLPASVTELSRAAGGEGGESETEKDPPMLVHCSAGVGRTGALILAETALALIRAAQPVYPLDLVRHMRAQRPLCIQNQSQYKFVCESILMAYNSGLVQPDRQSAK